jgi:hypothetical protein
LAANAFMPANPLAATPAASAAIVSKIICRPAPVIDRTIGITNVSVATRSGRAAPSKSDTGPPKRQPAGHRNALCQADSSYMFS